MCAKNQDVVNPENTLRRELGEVGSVVVVLVVLRGGLTVPHASSC